MGEVLEAGVEFVDLHLAFGEAVDQVAGDELAGLGAVVVGGGLRVGAELAAGVAQFADSGGVVFNLEGQESGFRKKLEIDSRLRLFGTLT